MASHPDSQPGNPESAGNASADYRPEIDGLRAIAVALAILFHAEVPGFDAGYLGVDIFFAISGFLITGIIVRSGELGRFSLRDFYMRRIRRIIPALVVVCMLTLPFAWLTMMPDELENFGQSLVATALSANNILLYLTSGYFAEETAFKPLFHTWSLGVEEQYYVIAPLLLMLAMRWGGRGGAFATLALCTALSLIFSENMRHYDPEANFMLLPSRFWELGLGGLAALAQPRLLVWIGGRGRLRQLLVAAGLAVVLTSPFLLSALIDLPGWQTLLPLLGTCIILILADHSGAGRLLTARPMVGLGLISYSAYLYHVPLFALLRVISLDAPSPGQLSAMIPLGLLLAWLSWRYVEQPFRDRTKKSDRTVLIFCGASLTAMVGAGLLLHLTAGFFEQSELARRDQQLGYEQTADYNARSMAWEGKPFPTAVRARNVMVVGNSFARDFINMGLENDAFSGFDLTYALVRNCEPVPLPVVERMRDAGAVILGSGVGSNEIACVQQKIALLESLQVPHIVVLGSKQFGYNNNAVMLLPPARRYSYRAKPLAWAPADNAVARREIPAQYFLDLLALLDDGTGTIPVFSPDGKFISQDRKHLTQAGARFIGEKVFTQPQFAWMAKRPD